MSERDPFEDLRDAWQSLDAPDPTPDTLDPQSRALMDALRSEWAELEPPPVQLPAGLGHRKWRQRSRALLQVAAALLLLIGGSWWLREWGGTAKEPLKADSQVASIDVPRPRDVSPADPQAQVPPASAVQARTVEPAPIEDGIVMTHGKVRLVMLIPKTTFEPLEGPQTTENSR